MPTYNYQCKNCGQQYEQFLKISDMNLPLENACDNCGEKGHIIKVITSTVGFVRPNDLKGLDGDFKFAMNQMKKRHRRSNIPDY